MAAQLTNDLKCTGSASLSGYETRDRLVIDPNDNRTFTEDLAAIAQHAAKEKITISEIEQILQGRGFATLSLVLCIPFVQPIPLPGLSVALGIAIMSLGLRLTLGQAGGLPNFLRRRELDGETVRKMTARSERVFRYVERFFKPRLAGALAPPMRNFIGLSIIASGLALSLPLPPVILFSNSLPAWAIIALCLGYLERDGLFILIGHFLSLATWGYFAFWWEAIKFAAYSFADYIQ